MSERETLLQLRDQLTASSGPDRLLDICIMEQVLGYRWVPRAEDPLIGVMIDMVDSDNRILSEDVPRFTARLDDAATLVPAEFRNFWCCGDQSEAARVFARYGYCEETTALTVPLALCLARVEYEIAKPAALVDEAEEQGEAKRSTPLTPPGD